MNRNDMLLASSLMALLCAGGGTLWLLWDSWEDKQALTRKNRELQASLEASRIRLENFCEYPVGALCDVDTPQGSLAELMDMNLPEPGNVQSSQQGAPAKPDIREKLSSASQASGNTTPGKPIDPADSVIQESGDSHPALLPVTESEQSSAATSPPQKNDSAVSLPIGPAPDMRPPLKENGGSISQPLTSKTLSMAPSVREKNSLVQEWLSSSKEEIPPGPTKKTWTNMSLTRDRFTFSLAGEGSSLGASGTLLDAPPRYVVVLEGLWRIKEPVVENDIITRLQKTFTSDRTLLTFHMKRMPESAQVEYKDPRTISITIH